MYKPFISNSKSLALIALLCLQHNLTYALPGDRDQAINIDADAAERSEKTGITSYIGNVELVQGSLNIQANRIDIFTINGEVDHAIAYGERAYFTQQQSADKEPVKAWAKTIKYSMNTEIINLIGDARIEQNSSIVDSPEIDYYADQELVKANGNSNTEENRVHVTLPPQKKTDETTGTTPPQSANEDVEKSNNEAEIETSETSLSDNVMATLEPIIEVIEPVIQNAKDQIESLSNTDTEKSQ